MSLELGTERRWWSAVTACDRVKQLLSIRPFTEEGLAIKPNLTEANPAAQGLRFRKDLKNADPTSASTHELKNDHRASTIKSVKIKKKKSQASSPDWNLQYVEVSEIRCGQYQISWDTSDFQGKLEGDQDSTVSLERHMCFKKDWWGRARLLHRGNPTKVRLYYWAASEFNLPH